MMAVQGSCYTGMSYIRRSVRTAFARCVKEIDDKKFHRMSAFVSARMLKEGSAAEQTLL